jgi:segregation and condensation protein B
MEVTEYFNGDGFFVGLEVRRAIEAVIFVAGEPVTAERLGEVILSVTGIDPPAPALIRRIVDDLNESYEEHGHAFRIEAWAGGYRMASEADVAPFIKAYLTERRSRRLSKSLLETLAVVAYRQPVTKPEIEFVRGVDADYALRRLLEYNLVDVVGRSDSIGRPLLYGTTPLFLEHFGLKEVDDLPSLREIEDLLDDPAFNRERVQLLMQRGLSLPEDDEPETDEPETDEPETDEPRQDEDADEEEGPEA